jgi:putative tryptophan/tyrosine transport system substrate-binding protein
MWRVKTSSSKNERRRENATEYPPLLPNLLRLQVDIIVTGAQGALAAKKASSTIPIVMTYIAAPVQQRAVTSLAHPGGNVTGLSDYHADLVTKRLDFSRRWTLRSRVSRSSLIRKTARTGPC